jgi:Glycoside-hydrolase family GH114
VAGNRWVKAMAALVAAGILTGAGAGAGRAAAQSVAVAPSYAPPPVNADADYQLGGAYKPAPGVRVVTRDRTDPPAKRRYGICYVNAFQTQPGELGWWKKHHSRLLLRHNGRLVNDPGWPDEVLLDTSTATKRDRLAKVVGSWIRGCAVDGYDAVEPDNLDSFSRSHHELTQRSNLRFVRLLVRAAHHHGLAIAQKNAAELTRRQVAHTGFDFAVAEDCQVYRECGRYKKMYGAHVIEIEYSDEGRANFRRACRARGDEWSIIYRDRDVRRAGAKGYKRAAC